MASMRFTVAIADDPFDAWRHAHFGDEAQTPEGALAGDYDGDRANNWAEYIAGTLPADSNSVFRVAELAASGGAISWPSVAGRRYAVQVSTNLLTGFADHPGASNLLSTPSVNVFTNGAFTNQSPLWYRLRVWRDD